MIKISQYGPVTRFDLARRVLRRGRYWTTAYLVDGMLVDSGCAHAAPELVHTLEDTPLSWLVNTHTHEDHIGANGFLQRQRPDLEILAHPAAQPVLADPRRAQPLQLYRRFFWGWPEASLAQPIGDGQVVETLGHRFQVIYTPGHSPDHLCLYESERGWLFTGDLFVGGRDRALREGYEIWEIIASLKHIAELPAERLFPGSARVREEPRSALKDKIDYLEETGQKVLDLWRKGWNVEQIASAVCGGPMWIEWVTWGHFSRRHLVESYLRGNVNALERWNV